MPSEYSTMHEIIRLIRIMYLIIYMNRSYSDYIDIINEVQHREDVVITDNKITKCCYYSLELIKLGIQNIKNKNVHININAKKEKQKE